MNPRCVVESAGIGPKNLNEYSTHPKRDQSLTYTVGSVNANTGAAKFREAGDRYLHEINITRPICINKGKEVDRRCQGEWSLNQAVRGGGDLVCIAVDHFDWNARIREADLSVADGK